MSRIRRHSFKMRDVLKEMCEASICTEGGECLEHIARDDGESIYRWIWQMRLVLVQYSSYSLMDVIGT